MIRNLSLYPFSFVNICFLYFQNMVLIYTIYRTTDWFQIGKRVRQGCILLPCLFNAYAKCIMRNAGLEETQARIKLARRNINNFRQGRKQRGPKEPLDEGIRGE